MFEQAESLIREFKGDSYLHGMAVLDRLGSMVSPLGSTAVLVRDAFSGSDSFIDQIRLSLRRAGIAILAETEGAAPNAPREDVARITAVLREYRSQLVVSFGGGSTIDATKAAEVLRSFGGELDQYFGTGLVSAAIKASGNGLTPHVAIQTAASSGAHLTKYSNITDLRTNQKKLIVDEATVPGRSAFDYCTTLGCPWPLTADGALDGISHCLEVLYSAVGKPSYALCERIALAAIPLILQYLPRVRAGEGLREGRQALGLATDLGGYAIMVGGTNGAHLTSFSLVDILSHGRACGLMNPYYTVLFASALERPVRAVGEVYSRAGFTTKSLEGLSGRELGITVARAMMEFETQLGLPTSLGEIAGFTDAHVDRALTAAKNPQLRMKLENMPVPLQPEQVDEYMGSVLLAAKAGEPELVKSL